MAIRSTLVRHGILAVLAGIVVYWVTISTSVFEQTRISAVGYYVVAVAGLSVLIGLSGQVSLGHGALMAVGGYTVAELLTNAPSVPAWADLIVAVLVTSVVGALTGAAAARLRGPYLAGATLALAVAVPDIARQYFGGDSGITSGISAVPAALPSLPLERWQAWICWLAALIALVLLANLARSRVGREWRAVRDDEVAASLAGINVARVQIVAFVTSAGCVGLAGGLLALVSTSVGPGDFQLTLSIGLLSAVILGGLGTLAGAVWGAIALVYFSVWSTDLGNAFSLPTNVANNLPLAVYGLILIVVILAFPLGIQGGIYRLLAPVSRALARRTKLRHTPAATAVGASGPSEGKQT